MSLREPLLICCWLLLCAACFCRLTVMKALTASVQTMNANSTEMQSSLGALTRFLTTMSDLPTALASVVQTTVQTAVQASLQVNAAEPGRQLPCPDGGKEQKEPNVSPDQAEAAAQQLATQQLEQEGQAAMKKYSNLDPHFAEMWTAATQRVSHTNHSHTK